MKDVERFLSGLRNAWKEGEVRPTARRRPPAPRGRRRPDPLAAVMNELRAFFEETPAQTGRELLERIQSAFPGRYPDALLRTVQRRIKGWCAEMAWALVFGRSETMSPDGAAADALRNGEAPRVSGHPILTESIE